MKGRRQQEALLGLGSSRISPKIPLSDKRALARVVGIGVCGEAPFFFSPVNSRRTQHPGPRTQVIICKDGWWGGEPCWCPAGLVRRTWGQSSAPLKWHNF